MGMRMKFSVVVAVLAVCLAGCNPKPAHYLVLCDAKDTNDWMLIDTVKENGYIMSCTYQSPDKSQTYTRKCDSDGCNIQ